MEAVIALSFERVQTLEANPEGVVYTAIEPSIRPF